jgi:hypothetical protein
VNDQKVEKASSQQQGKSIVGTKTEGFSWSEGRGK